MHYEGISRGGLLWECAGQGDLDELVFSFQLIPMRMSRTLAKWRLNPTDESVVRELMWRE